ncbi:MAG: alpha/beta fold hydrolase, partial [Oxalobacteraceae bacterium]
IELLKHQGHRVATYTWGDPAQQPLVLLAHGWSSFGLRFTPWVRALRQAGYAVATFDQLAHGRSSGRRATLPSFAETLYQVAHHYGPLHAVVGHSLGGAATMLALSRGMAAERVVLVAPAADPMAAADRFGSAVGLAPSLRTHLFDEFERRFRMRVAGMQAHVNVPYLARPALVVHDIEDREVPWSEGERYARYWPQARLLSTTGLGHHRIAMQPEVIADALRFLAGERVGERVVSTPDLPFGVA